MSFEEHQNKELADINQSTNTLMTASRHVVAVTYSWYTVKKYFQDLLSQHFFLLSNQLK